MVLDKSSSELTLLIQVAEGAPATLAFSLEEAAGRALPMFRVHVKHFQDPGSDAAPQEGRKKAAMLKGPVCREIFQKVKATVPSNAAALFNAARIEETEETVRIICKSELVVERMKALSIPARLEKEMDEAGHASRQIIFEIGHVDLPEDTKDQIRRTPKKSPYPQILLGKEIVRKRKITPIREIVTPGSNIIVEGVALCVEKRDLWKTLVTFICTDFGDSIRVKLMDAPETLWGLRDGDRVRVRGSVAPDRFEFEELVMRPLDVERLEPDLLRDNGEPRVELNAHTKFSRLNGLIDLEALVERAAAWNWPAVALTDNGVVQGFPKFYSMAKKAGIKPILGCELNYVDDQRPIVLNLPPRSRGKSISLDRDAVVFDLETTGLSPLSHKVIEIAAYRIHKNRIVEEFETFVNPGEKISETISEITNITDEDVAGSPKWPEVLAKFKEFVGDGYLVAHNIRFDAGFLRGEWEKDGDTLPPLLDTLGVSRVLNPELKTFNLRALAKAYSVSLVNAHRASDDARALARIYIEMLLKFKEKGVEDFKALVEFGKENLDCRKLFPEGVTVLVRDRTGLKNLYDIITAGHLEYMRRVPRTPASLLDQKRQGLLIGSSALNGPLIEAILSGDSAGETDALLDRFDYIEVAPPGAYNDRIDGGSLRSRSEVEKLIERMISLAKQKDKPVVAVSAAHHLEHDDLHFRKILRYPLGQARAERLPSLPLKSTDELLEDFRFLGDDLAREIVIENPIALIEDVEDVPPVPDGFYPPHIEGAADELREKTYARAKELYGIKQGKKIVIPANVEAAIEKELTAIIGNGFAVLYLISVRLVENSMKAGYVVGSRGSVGSSVVAFLTGITEVNPLPPHYRCAVCKTSLFVDSEDDWKGKGVAAKAGCGPDLPVRECCGEEMTRDGYRIPFEAFMGFDGTKVPDIDLNFAGEYQAEAMADIQRTFGKEKVYRAGTLNTLQQKNAAGYVRNYMETHAMSPRRAEIERLSLGLTEVAKTTGQHPGGIVIIPQDKEITDFMPVQRPADAEDSEWITTHYDFHSYDTALVKVDVLGHDAPTAIRELYELTGIDPMDVPVNDPDVLSLFSSTKALNISSEKFCQVGTYAIPELGTPFVLGMLIETKPTTVEELLRISGLSHGTDVWLGNAQELIQNGSATLSNVIATREDIMNKLLAYGVEPVKAFQIMEKVRKGKGLDPQDEALMKKHKVEPWVIESCQKIKYLFPRAHAVAYVLMALRIAWFKVHRPAAFYAAWLSAKITDFPLEVAMAGERKITERLTDIRKREQAREASKKEESEVVVLDILREMCLRGIKFAPVDVFRSKVRKFHIEDDKTVRVPLMAVEGLGEKVAIKLGEVASTAEDVKSMEDILIPAGVSRTIAERLKKYRAFGDLPETNQMTLF